jgi:hypothetical protein
MMEMLAGKFSEAKSATDVQEILNEMFYGSSGPGGSGPDMSGYIPEGMEWIQSLSKAMEELGPAFEQYTSQG